MLDGMSKYAILELMPLHLFRFAPDAIGVRLAPVECFEMMCLLSNPTFPKDSIQIEQVYAPPTLDPFDLLEGLTRPVVGNGGRRGSAPPT